MEICPAEVAVGFGKLPGGEFLVQIGDHEKHRAAGHDDDAEMRMHEIDNDHEERHQRRIEKRDQRAGCQEAAQKLQILQRLIILAAAMQRCSRCSAEDRRAELDFQFHRGAHQDEAPDRIHEGLQQDGADHGDREHDERIDGAARQHPVGYLEEIERDCQQKDVDGDREHHDDHHVASHRRHAPREAGGEIHRLAALVKTAAASSAPAPAAPGIGILAVSAAAGAQPPVILADRTAFAFDGLAEGHRRARFELGLLFRQFGGHPRFDPRLGRCFHRFCCRRARRHGGRRRSFHIRAFRRHRFLRHGRLNCTCASDVGSLPRRNFDRLLAAVGRRSNGAAEPAKILDRLVDRGDAHFAHRSVRGGSGRNIARPEIEGAACRKDLF